MVAEEDENQEQTTISEDTDTPEDVIENDEIVDSGELISEPTDSEQAKTIEGDPEETSQE